MSSGVLSGMALVAGQAEGPLALSSAPVAVARIDPETSILHEARHPLKGRNLAAPF